jgi:hypothetical protein
MVYDPNAEKIISSGLANGVSSVHGRLGHPPTGLVGPDANDAISDQSGRPSASREHRSWRRLFGGK